MTHQGTQEPLRGTTRLGLHTLKGWSSTQGVTALPSGGAAFYAMVSGGLVGLGLQRLMGHLGTHTDLTIKKGTRVAKAFTRNRGLGHVRHSAVNQLWTHDHLNNGNIMRPQVITESMLADTPAT